MAKRVKKLKYSLDKQAKKAFGVIGVVFLLMALVVAKWAGLPVDFLFENQATTSQNKTTPSQNETTPSQKAELSEGIYDVERCVDGDTLILANASRTRIRLIGADTPETVKPNTPVQPFGPEASQFTKDAIAKNGNKVGITFDGTQIDRYGRTLAMVWLGDSLLNEMLIREGLAKAQLQYKYSRAMKERFQAAEDSAKREKRGLWSL